jgi:hypothetical protein
MFILQRSSFVTSDGSLFGKVQGQRQARKWRGGAVRQLQASMEAGNVARRRWAFQQAKRQAEETIRKVQEARRKQEELMQALDMPVRAPPPPPTSVVRDTSHLEAVRREIEANRQAAQRAAELAREESKATGRAAGAATSTATSSGVTAGSGWDSTAGRSAAAAAGSVSAPSTAASKDAKGAAGSGDAGTAAPKAAGSASTPASPSASAGATATNRASGSMPATGSAASTKSSPAPPASETSGGRTSQPPKTSASASEPGSGGADGPTKTDRQGKQPSMLASTTTTTTTTSPSSSPNELGRHRLSERELRPSFTTPGESDRELESLRRARDEALPQTKRGVSFGDDSTRDDSGSAQPFVPEWTSPGNASAPSSGPNRAPLGSRVQPSDGAVTYSAPRDATYIASETESITAPRSTTASVTPSSAGSERNAQDRDTGLRNGTRSEMDMPSNDRDASRSAAPKGFGMYIRRAGRENKQTQHGDSPADGLPMPQGSLGDESSTRDASRNPGGESPVPNARIHGSRAPVTTTNGVAGSPATSSRNTPNVAADLEHKVIDHLRSGTLTTLTVPQLRSFLQQQKLPTTGKKKDLVEQVERWWQAAHHQIR